MSDFTIAWIIWIAFFFAIEGEALFSKQPHVNTLSAHLWQWGAMSGKPKMWIARRAVLMATLIWLFVHLMFHWSGIIQRLKIFL